MREDHAGKLCCVIPLILGDFHKSKSLHHSRSSSKGRPKKDTRVPYTASSSHLLRTQLICWHMNCNAIVGLAFPASALMASTSPCRMSSTCGSCAVESKSTKEASKLQATVKIVSDHHPGSSYHHRKIKVAQPTGQLQTHKRQKTQESTRAERHRASPYRKLTASG